jgi:hypothetical protein
LKCEGEESLGMSDEGVLQYGVAIVRACPQYSCASKTQGGCTKGHADFAIPLEDFVQAYIQDQQANMQMDDAQQIGDYATCGLYNGNNGGDVQYYVGPACTSHGKDIKLGVFEDEYCQTASKTTFAEISNGATLPYSDGGLVSKKCLSCSNEDGSLKEMCSTFYEDAALKCEQWDISHYYWDSITLVYRFGKDQTGCKYIDWMDKSDPGFTEWATIVMLLIMVFGSFTGAVYYTRWWKESTYRLWLQMSIAPFSSALSLLVLMLFLFIEKATLTKLDDDDSESASQYKAHPEDESVSTTSVPPIDQIGLFDGIFT